MMKCMLCTSGYFATKTFAGVLLLGSHVLIMGNSVIFDIYCNKYCLFVDQHSPQMQKHRPTCIFVQGIWLCPLWIIVPCYGYNWNIDWHILWKIVTPLKYIDSMYEHELGIIAFGNYYNHYMQWSLMKWTNNIIYYLYSSWIFRVWHHNIFLDLHVH